MDQEHVARILEAEAQKIREGKSVVREFECATTLGELEPLNGYRRKALVGYQVRLRCDAAEGLWKDTPRG